MPNEVTAGMKIRKRETNPTVVLSKFHTNHVTVDYYISKQFMNSSI